MIPCVGLGGGTVVRRVAGHSRLEKWGLNTVTYGWTALTCGMTQGRERLLAQKVEKQLDDER